MGGIWGRIIRTAKNIMLSIIKNSVLTHFQLTVIFTEIEEIVNNRPLTYVSDNPYDLELLTLLVGQIQQQCSYRRKRLAHIKLLKMEKSSCDI